MIFLLIFAILLTTRYLQLIIKQKIPTYSETWFKWGVPFRAYMICFSSSLLYPMMVIADGFPWWTRVLFLLAITFLLAVPFFPNFLKDSWEHYISAISAAIISLWIMALLNPWSFLIAIPGIIMYFKFKKSKGAIAEWICFAGAPLSMILYLL